MNSHAPRVCLHMIRSLPGLLRYRKNWRLKDSSWLLTCRRCYEWFSAPKQKYRFCPACKETAMALTERTRRHRTAVVRSAYACGLAEPLSFKGYGATISCSAQAVKRHRHERAVFNMMVELGYANQTWETYDVYKTNRQHTC